MAMAGNEKIGTGDVMDDGGDNGLQPRDLFLDEESSDFQAQLAQKDHDLNLAAELGKALLQSNNELEAQYDMMVDDFNRKIEILHQDKYDLHLELSNVNTQHHNIVKDLQEEVNSLKKQLSSSSQLEIDERERSRSLREAQQTSDYLREQMHKVSAREEELEKELDQLKIQNETNMATIQDQIDHIAMLREQIEYLSEKLQDANQKLIEMQGERDLLANALEEAHERLQNLEQELATKDVQVLKQGAEIEGLRESNSNLRAQLQRRPSLNFYSAFPAPASTQSQSNNVSFGRSATQMRSKSLNSPTTETVSADPLSLSPKASQLSPLRSRKHKTTESTDGECISTPTSIRSPEEIKQDLSLNEKSLQAELDSCCISKRDSPPTMSQLSLSAESPRLIRHRRNISDCSISSLTEVSRKRHHENIEGSSDEDDSDEKGDKTGPSTGCKQTLYSKSVKNHYGSPRSSLEKSPMMSSPLRSSQDKTLPQSTHSNAVLQRSPNVEESYGCDKDETISKVGERLSSDDNFLEKGDTDVNFFLSSKDEVDGESSMVTSPELEDRLFLPPGFSRQESGSHEQSLFSELSSQLMDDKHGGSSSDSSSGCMLGRYGLCPGQEGEDNERGTEYLLSKPVTRDVRLDSDLGYHTDWHNMTCVTNDMLDEDDFECDDDDFLVGNLAGTTLSIGDSGHSSLGYRYHYYNEVEEETEGHTESLYRTGSSPLNRETGDLSVSQNSQDKISQACVEMRELVVKVQGHLGSTLLNTLDQSSDDLSPDTLLELIEKMRLCVDQITTQQVSDSDEESVVFSAPKPVEKQKKSLKSGKDKEKRLSPKRLRDLMEKTSLMRKSKSSSSLSLRASH